MISEAIKKIVDKHDLSYDEAYKVMKEIMQGKTTQTQNAAFLAALSTKSTHAETIDEICGCAEAMRECATAVPYDQKVLISQQRPHLLQRQQASKLLNMAIELRVRFVEQPMCLKLWELI